MVSGRDTLASIEQSIRDIQSSERRLQGDLEEINGERANLLGQRLEAFRELAEVRAKNALADGVIDRADHLSHQVESILNARAKTISQLRSRMDEAHDQRENLMRKYDKTGLKIADLEKQLDELGEQARHELSSNATYKKRRQLLADTRKTYDQARRKAKQSEGDRERKGMPYQNDALFMYLWRRKYGSKDYQHTRLVRWLDNWVAGLVGYTDARANYAVLLEIPVRLREHVKEIEDRLSSAQTDVDQLEAEKIRELAGLDLPQSIERTRAEQEKQSSTLEELAAELSESDSQLNRYAAGHDHSFRKAVDQSAEFLEKTSFSKLMRLARATKEPSDDSIVEHISNLDDAIEDLLKRIDDRRKQLERLFDRKEELMRISAEFRRTHYDDPGSIFVPEGDVQDLLEELLRGVITGAEYWSRTRRHQRWRSRPADPYRRGNHMPPFNGEVLPQLPDFGEPPDFRTGGGF